MKKILIFSLSYYPLVGGHEVAIDEITSRIAPDDIEFHLITLRFSKSSLKQEKINNIHIYRIGFGSAYMSKILFVPLAAIAAARLHKTIRIDAMWAILTYMVFPIVLLRLAGIPIPYAVTLQDGDPFERQFGRWHIKPFIPLIRYGFSHASMVQVISTFLVAWAKRAGYKGKIEIIPNGANPRHFSQTYSIGELEEFKKKMGKRAEHIYLVSTSRLVNKNAVDDVIRALALLPPHIHLLVVGDGPDREKLEILVRDQGLIDRVKFTGHVDRTETPKYLRISDIFVRPSRSEGMGNSFASAMAARIPFIATQEGGIADFLFDAKRNPDKKTTGWAVDKDSPEQIAKAVTEIIQHPDHVAQVVSTAYDLAFKTYNWDFIAQRMRTDVFDVILQKSK